MNKKEIMLLVGLVFGLAAGFVLGWLWGDRPNYLSDVRVLDVLIAIGTIGAAIGAAYAARIALNIGKEQIRQMEQKKITKAEVVAFSLMPKLTIFSTQLKQCLEIIKSNEKLTSSQFTDVSKKTNLYIEILNDISDSDLKSYVELDRMGAYYLAEMKSYINLFYDEYKDLAAKQSVPGWVNGFYISANGKGRLETFQKRAEDITQNISDHNSKLQKNSPQIIYE